MTGAFSARFFLLAGLTALVLLTLGTLAVSRLTPGPRRHGGGSAQGTASSPGGAALPTSSGLLERELPRRELNQLHIQAFNAVITRWDAQPVRSFSGSLTSLATFTSLAARRKLSCTPFRGTLDDAIRFNLPFLMVTRISDGAGRPYCLAVTATDGDTVAISPPLPGTAGMSRRELADAAQGSYYLFWRNRGGIPLTLRRGEKRVELRHLQQQLARTGFYRQPINGEYDDATIRAVRRFQQSQGIAVNDGGGALTLALLSRADSGRRIPTLNGKQQENGRP